MCRLIDSSLISVYIISGGLNPKIYNHKDIINAVTNARGRRVSIKIISNLNKIKENYKAVEDIKRSFLKFIIDKRVDLYNIDKDLREVNHFIVVDRKSFRLEEIHNSEETRQGIIVFKSKKARLMYDFFNQLLKEDYCKRIFSQEIEDFIENIVKKLD